MTIDEQYSDTAKLKSTHGTVVSVSFCELNDIITNDDVMVIIDANVIDSYHDLIHITKDRTIILPSDINPKTTDCFIYLCNELTAKQANKNTHLLGIGGGNLTDLVGFAASVYMRGIKVSFAPTTLLALVDAAIGGKNALNIGNLKNLIGSIYPPQNVYVNTQFINTLTKVEFLSGFAEIIKIGLLFDNKLLTDSSLWLANNNNSTLKTNAQLDAIILRSIEHKMRIVTEDIFSTGKRNLLNFGHTIGHALELQHKLPHGWAVALGMLLETAIAVEIELTTPVVLNEIRQIIITYYNTGITAFNWNMMQLIENIQFDKKIFDDDIKFPVIVDIGKSKLFDIKINDFISCLRNTYLLYE